MNYASIVSTALADVQSTLAQMGGMDAGAAGNTLFAGQTVPVIGVYGNPFVQEIPVAGGGYRKRTVVPLRIAKSRLSVAPAAKTKLTRTDTTPHVTYVVDAVGTQESVDWVFFLINFAD